MTGRVMITGITGMIGGRLGRTLAEGDLEIHGVARFSKAHPSVDEVKSWGVTPWRRDLTADSLDDLPDVDYLIHQACQWDAPKGSSADNGRSRSEPQKAESDDPKEVAATNSTMALKVMYRWRDARAAVLASTGGVYPESTEVANEDIPPAPGPEGYHLGKYAMEQIGIACSAEFGTPTAILRYYWPMDFEEHAAFYVAAVSKSEPIPGTGAEYPYRFAPIDLVDVCRYTVGALDLADSPPTILLCGGPEIVSRRELVQIAADGLGVDPVFDDRPGEWPPFLSDSSRLFEILGEPERHLPETVREVARAARR